MAKKVKITIAADTSNYTTSTAAADENGNIIAQARRLLKVKEGERGLRQSDALFQHIVNMPEMMSQLMKQVREDAAARGDMRSCCKHAPASCRGLVYACISCRKGRSSEYRCCS